MTDMAVPVAMKDYGVFAATRSAALPKGWLIPTNPRLTAAVERLRLHGLKLEEISTPAQVSVERFTITAYTRAERVFQGHREARLAFYLLEPESDDGLVTWNIIEEGLARL